MKPSCTQTITTKKKEKTRGNAGEIQPKAREQSTKLPQETVTSYLTTNRS